MERKDENLAPGEMTDERLSAEMVRYSMLSEITLLSVIANECKDRKLNERYLRYEAMALLLGGVWLTRHPNEQAQVQHDESLAMIEQSKLHLLGGKGPN